MSRKIYLHCIGLCTEGDHPVLILPLAVDELAGHSNRLPGTVPASIVFGRDNLERVPSLGSPIEKECHARPCRGIPLTTT